MTKLGSAATRVSALALFSSFALSACGDDDGGAAAGGSPGGGAAGGHGGSGGMTAAGAAGKVANGGGAGTAAKGGGTASGGAGTAAKGGGTASGGASANAGKAAIGTGGSAGTAAVSVGGKAASGGTAGDGTSAGNSAAGSAGDAGGAAAAGAGAYLGPSVGTAKSFAVLAYSAVTAANISQITGEIGVSAGAVSTITGFDAPTDVKYGLDSVAPNEQRTILAQANVTSLVSNIDPRPCDADYTNVVGGLTGDITLYPGVTCMNSFSADVLLNGHVTLDAEGDPNAFFIIRGNLTLTVADGAQVVLANGAEACGVFWRFSTQVTIGKTVQFYGTIISGTAITMSTASALTGRALAQTAGVHLDANTINVPVDGLVASAAVCTHLQ